MTTENHVRIQVLIRMIMALIGMNILINLPDNIYSAIRTKGLFLFPDNPGLGALLSGLGQLGLCALGFFLSKSVSRIVLWKVDLAPNDGMMSSKELASILYFGLALFFFWKGFNEATSALIFGFQKNGSWNPFSGGFPSPFYALLEAIVCFALMYVLMFKKSWLPGT